MRDPEALCSHVAQALVNALCAKGSVRLRTEQTKVAKKIADTFVENFRAEAKLEREAELLADQHLDDSSTVDRHRVVQLIKRKLADERDFAL